MPRIAPLIALLLGLLLGLPVAAHAGMGGTSITLTAANTFESPNGTGYEGTTLAFRWQVAGATHDLASYDGAWPDTGPLTSAFPDQARFSKTFPNAGRFEFLCRLHPDMRGSISIAPGTSNSAFLVLDARPGLGSSATTEHVAGTGPTAVSPALELAPPGPVPAAQARSARARITSGRQPGDALAAPGGVWDAASGTLTIPGPLGYEAMRERLRAVTFATSGGAGTRRVTFDSTYVSTPDRIGNPDYRDVVVSDPPATPVGPSSPVPTSPAPPTSPGAAPSALITAPGIAPAAFGFRLAGGPTAVADRRGRVRLVLLTTPGLRGTVTLERPAGARPARLGRAAFAATHAGRVAVRVALSSKGRAAVRRAGRRGLALQVTIRNGTQQASRPVRVRAARR